MLARLIDRFRESKPIPLKISGKVAGIKVVKIVNR